MPPVQLLHAIVKSLRLAAERGDVPSQSVQLLAVLLHLQDVAALEFLREPVYGLLLLLAQLPANHDGDLVIQDLARVRGFRFNQWSRSVP